MHDNLIYNCGNLFRLVQQHLQSPTRAMSTEMLDRNFGNCQPLQRFLIPMSTTLALASIVGTLVWSDDPTIAAVVYGMLMSAMLPFMVYFVLKVASCKIFSLFGIEENFELKAQTVTLQLMLLYFTVTFLCTILPGARLMACLYVYAFYMLWHMAGEYLGIPDEQRMKFMLYEMAVCALTLVVISTTMNFITPKHP